MNLLTRPHICLHTWSFCLWEALPTRQAGLGKLQATTAIVHLLLPSDTSHLHSLDTYARSCTPPGGLLSGDLLSLIFIWFVSESVIWDNYEYHLQKHWITSPEISVVPMQQSYIGTRNLELSSSVYQLYAYLSSMPTCFFSLKGKHIQTEKL